MQFLPVHAHDAAFGTGRTVKQEHRLGTPCADEAGKAKDFSPVQLEADIFHTVAAEVLDLQHDLLPGRIVLDRIVIGKFAPDHQLNQTLLVRVLNADRVDVLAVPEDGNPVTDLKQLIQAVGDVDDGNALLLEIADDIEQPALFFHGDGCCGFIQDQHAGIAENGFADLHDLAVGHRKLTNPGLGSDVALKFFQQFRSFFIPLRVVDEEAAVAAVAHEEVVRHGHCFKLDHLLIYHGDAQLQ